MARPAVNANNLKQTPIPVVGSRLQLTNGDGTITRSGQLLLEQLQDVSGAGGAGGNGPFIRTLVLYDLTVGAAIAPFVPIFSPGPGLRAIGVLRKTITSNLVITITRNAESSPLFTFTLPASTPIHTDVVHDISSVTFKDLDVLIPGITASDSSQDADGVATLTIEWNPDTTTSSSGSGSGGGFTAAGDLAGSSTTQSVVGLAGVPLDAATVSAPANGQVIEYDSASGRYKAVTPASGFTAAGDLSGTSTTQKVIGLESVPLDATTVGSPANGQVIEYNSAAGKYQAVAPAVSTIGGDLGGTGTVQKVVGLEGVLLDPTTVGAPADGQVITYNAASGKYKAVTPTGGAAPVVIGFVINSGAAGTNVGPMLAAPHAGSVTKCVITTKASDASTALTIVIRQNGTSVFTANPTVSAGTASGSVSTFSTLTSSPLPIAAGDVFSIDITGGTSSWLFTAQLE